MCGGPSVFDLSETMLAEKSALVYISRDAIYAPLAGILPHGNVSLVEQLRFHIAILGYHELIVVYGAEQVFIIEVGIGIEQRFLPVCLLYEGEELE